MDRGATDKLGQVTMRRIVIVGAGLAGASAAFALRDAGYDGDVVLVGDESQLPYNRPGLSKEYMRDESTLPDLWVKPRDEYARRAISLRLGEGAISIDPERRSVRLAGGDVLGYDRLLVTTGARNRRLAVPGSDLAGVLGLRTLDDADRIRGIVGPGSRAVVVGMGFIGSEVAASLRQLGAEVTVIARGPAPFASVLGEEVGAVIADLHRERGVTLRLGDTVTAFEGAGRLERVRTASGQLIACDVAIVGIGVEPAVELLSKAGAAIGDGVLVDEMCRTSLPDVYAAGDVAATQHPVFGRARVEHWNNARMQGRAAAASLLGQGRPYDYIHSFWSDQYDHSLEYVGLAPTWDAVVFRGRPESHRFLGFYLRAGRLRAVVGLDRGGDPEDRIRGSELKKCVPLIREQARVDPVRLADEDVLLRDTVIA